MIVESQKRCQSARSSSTRRSRASSICLGNLQHEQIKENQLHWLFNRRKQRLKQTSQANVAMYLRIIGQKPSISGFNSKKQTSKRKAYLRRRMLPNKQNIDLTAINSQLQKRSQEITRELNAGKLISLLRL